jgi:Zn-dependent peptidase ImmA (M78 family)/DNA-binding XRE family transcriptional regulator
MFNPKLLTIARKRRRLTGEGLARAIGVAPLTISRIENGKNDPSPETVDAIVGVLKFPKKFFYGPDIESPPQESVSFRSLAAMTSKERDAALSAGSFAFLLSDWITERFNLPEADLIDLSFEKDALRAAMSIRQHWALGQQPINNMVKLLESKGIMIFSLSENTKNLDAFSCWRNDKPYIFLNTFKSAEHSRFDAAHELGHLVLHRHGGPHQKSAEYEANMFASGFLMPEADIRSNISIFYMTSVNQLIQMKKRWGVSIAALIYRLHKTGLITDHKYRSLNIEISKMGYRKNEPDGLPREESIIWKTVFTELWSDRITKDNISQDHLSLPVEEIENLIYGLLGSANLQGSAKKTGTPLRLVS